MQFRMAESFGRNKIWVHTMCDLDEFVAAVKRKGFHLFETGDQYVIVCNDGDIRLVC
jgi:hypothetical protein